MREVNKKSGIMAVQLPEHVKLKIQSIQRFLLRSSVPLLYKQALGNPKARGTGTFFKIADRSFLITARHFFDVDSGEDPIDPYGIVVPAGLQTQHYLSMGNLTLSRPTVAAIDVAVIELTDPHAVSELQKFWHFLTLENVAVGMEFRECWIVGYPKKAIDVSSQLISIEPLTLNLDILTKKPRYIENPVVPGLDYLLHYPKKGELLGVGVKATPGVLGVSGASVWTFTGDPVHDEKWVPEEGMKIIGIQSAWSERSRYLRVKSWWAVAKSLAKLDPDIANLILTSFNLKP